MLSWLGEKTLSTNIDASYIFIENRYIMLTIGYRNWFAFNLRHFGDCFRLVLYGSRYILPNLNKNEQYMFKVAFLLYKCKPNILLQSDAERLTHFNIDKVLSTIHSPVHMIHIQKYRADSLF